MDTNKNTKLKRAVTSGDIKESSGSFVKQNANQEKPSWRNGNSKIHPPSQIVTNINNSEVGSFGTQKSKVITPTKAKDPLLQSLNKPFIPSLDLQKSKNNQSEVTSWKLGSAVRSIEDDEGNTGHNAQSAPGVNHLLERTTKTGGNSSEKVSDHNLRSFKSKYSEGKKDDMTRQQKNEKLQQALDKVKASAFNKQMTSKSPVKRQSLFAPTQSSLLKLPATKPKESSIGRKSMTFGKSSGGGFDNLKRINSITSDHSGRKSISRERNAGSFNSSALVLASNREKQAVIKELSNKKTIRKSAEKDNSSFVQTLGLLKNNTKLLKGVKTFESSSSSGKTDDNMSHSFSGSETNFDKILDRRSNSDHESLLLESVRLRESLAVVVSEKPINLNEPQIYANRLLGIKINFKDKIVIKNKDGQLQRVVRNKGEEDLNERIGSVKHRESLNSMLNNDRGSSTSKIKKFNLSPLESREQSIGASSGKRFTNDFWSSAQKVNELVPKENNLDLEQIIQINKEFKEREQKKLELKQQLQEIDRQRMLQLEEESRLKREAEEKRIAQIKMAERQTRKDKSKRQDTQKNKQEQLFEKAIKEAKSQKREIEEFQSPEMVGKTANKPSVEERIEKLKLDMKSKQTSPTPNKNKVSLVSDKKVFEYTETTGNENSKPTSWQEKSNLSGFSAGAFGSTSQLLRRQPVHMTPHMHKVLLNLRIALGVPATQYKEGDIKLSLPPSLTNSQIDSEKGEENEDPLQFLVQDDLQRELFQHQKRIDMAQQVLKLNDYMIRMGVPTDDEVGNIDKHILENDSEMEFEENNIQQKPQHVLEMQTKFRTQLKLRESLNIAMTCLLTRDSKSNICNTLNKFRPDWKYKQDKVKTSDIIGVLNEVHRLMSHQNYQKAISFILKVQSENEMLNEVLNIWMALSFLFQHERNPDADYSQLRKAIDICHHIQMSKSITAHFILLYVSIKYGQELDQLVKLIKNPQITALVDTPEYYAHKIKQLEEAQVQNIFKQINTENCYIGYLAFAFIKVFSKDEKQRTIGEEILTEIIIDQSDKLEPYLLIFASSKNFGGSDDQIQLLDKLFLYLNMQPRSLIEKLLFTELYSKSLCRHGQYHRAFNLLQIEFAKHPSYQTALLYLFGKLVVKYKQVEFYTSAQCALFQCTKTNNKSYYYLAQTFLRMKKYDFALKYFQKTKNLSENKRAVLDQFYMQHLPSNVQQFVKNLNDIESGQPIDNFDDFLAKVQSKWGIVQSQLLRVKIYHNCLKVDYKESLEILSHLDENLLEVQLAKLEILVKHPDEHDKILQICQTAEHLLSKPKINGLLWQSGILLVSKCYKKVDEINPQTGLITKAIKLFKKLKSCLPPVEIHRVLVKSRQETRKYQNIVQLFEMNQVECKWSNQVSESQIKTINQVEKQMSVVFERSSVPRISVLNQMQKITLLGVENGDQQVENSQNIKLALSIESMLNSMYLKPTSNIVVSRSASANRIPKQTIKEKQQVMDLEVDIESNLSESNLGMSALLTPKTSQLNFDIDGTSPSLTPMSSRTPTNLSGYFGKQSMHNPEEPLINKFLLSNADGGAEKGGPQIPTMTDTSFTVISDVEFLRKLSKMCWNKYLSLKKQKEQPEFAMELLEEAFYGCRDYLSWKLYFDQSITKCEKLMQEIVDEIIE